MSQKLRNDLPIPKHPGTQNRTRKLVYCSMLVAVGALMGGGLPIRAFVLGTFALKISFGMLPVLLAGAWFGPLWGGAVGALADTLQALMFPVGAYIPWFSVSAALFGIIPGLFFLRTFEIKPRRALVAVATTLMITSVGANTALIVALFGSPWEIIYARAITQSVMIPIHTILLVIVDRSTRFIRLRSRSLQ